MRKHSYPAKWAQGRDNNVQQWDDAEERRSRLLLCVRKDQENENIKNGSYDTFTGCESDLGCHVDNDQPVCLYLVFIPSPFVLLWPVPFLAPLLLFYSCTRLIY